jgi:GNAT superfamily N-acetyltransferase
MHTTPQENLKRMIKLAEEFFGTRNDPEQISISGKVINKLRKIHPSTMTEKKMKEGPIAWILVIPTTQVLMKQFIQKQINERELLDKTPFRENYDAVYLCSALVLPEYRRKGLAKNLAIKAIKSIKKQYPINALFYWAFSTEGKKLAASIAKELSLPLYERVNYTNPIFG